MDSEEEAVNVFHSQIRRMVNNREGVQIVKMAQEMNKRMSDMLNATDREAQAKIFRQLRDVHSRITEKMEDIGKILNEVEPHMSKAMTATAAPISAVEQAIAAAAAAPASTPSSSLTTSAFLRNRKPLTAAKSPARSTAVAPTAHSPRSVASLKRPANRPPPTIPSSTATANTSPTPLLSSPEGKKTVKIVQEEKENKSTPQAKPQEKKNYGTLDGWMRKVVKKEVEEQDGAAILVEEPVVDVSSREDRSIEAKRASRSSGRRKFELSNTKQEVEEAPTQTLPQQEGETAASASRPKRVKVELLEETVVTNNGPATIAESVQPPTLHGRGRASKWDCAACGEVCSNHSAIYSHMLNEHEGEIVAKCEGCGLLDSFPNLIVHRKEGQRTCGRRRPLFYWFKKDNEKPEEEMNEEEKEEKRLKENTTKIVTALRACMRTGCEELGQDRGSFKKLNEHYRAAHKCIVYYTCPVGVGCGSTFLEPLQFVRHQKKCARVIPDMWKKEFKEEKAVLVVKKEKRWC